MKRAWLCLGILLVGSGLPVYAGRPLVVDDAGTLEAGQWQIEAGLGYRNESECNHSELPVSLTYGLVPGLEAGVGFGGQFEERTELGTERARERGVGDLIMSAKWQLLQESRWLPAQTLAPAIKLPTADDTRGLGSGRTDYDVTWIASKVLLGKAGLHGNLGCTWLGDPAGEDLADLLHYGLAADYEVVRGLQVVGEVLAQQELKGGADAVWQYDAGLRWEATAGLVLDIDAGSRLTGEDPDFTATAGLTWVLGPGRPSGE
jgi:hypothetical protein